MTTVNLLSTKEKTDFDRDGFVVIKKMYSDEEIKQLADWMDGLVQRGPEFGKEMFYYEDSLLEKGKKVLSRIERFSKYHPLTDQLIHAPKMLNRVSVLLGEPAILFKEKINFKMSGGEGFAPHQDIQPGWDDYASYFISVLVTVDPSTLENGCLELSAGHHKKGWLGERMKPLTENQLKGVVFTPYPMDPGDVAFFDCFVPHQSKPNLTNHQRRNLYLTYNRASQGDKREKYFADKRQNFPPDNEREPGKEYKFKV